MARSIGALTRAVLFTPLFTVSRPAKVVLEVRRTPPTELVQKAVEELLGDRAVKARGDAPPAAADIARVAETLFDVREMAKKSLARHWVMRTPQERDSSPASSPAWWGAPGYAPSEPASASPIPAPRLRPPAPRCAP
jgi:hypothetical protein